MRRGEPLPHCTLANTISPLSIRDSPCVLCRCTRITRHSPFDHTLLYPGPYYPPRPLCCSFLAQLPWRSQFPPRASFFCGGKARERIIYRRTFGVARASIIIFVHKLVATTSFTLAPRQTPVTFSPFFSLASSPDGRLLHDAFKRRRISPLISRPVFNPG